MKQYTRVNMLMNNFAVLLLFPVLLRAARLEGGQGGYVLSVDLQHLQQPAHCPTFLKKLEVSFEEDDM